MPGLVLSAGFNSANKQEFVAGPASRPRLCPEVAISLLFGRPLITDVFLLMSGDRFLLLLGGELFFLFSVAHRRHRSSAKRSKSLKSCMTDLDRYFVS